MRIPRPKHVRTRLALWYVFVLASVLVLSWGLTASFLFFQLRNQLDHYAVQDIETVEGLLFIEPSGRLILREDYHNHPESKLVLERLVEIRSADGSVLYRNERLGDQALGGNPMPRRRGGRLLHPIGAPCRRNNGPHGEPSSHSGRPSNSDPAGL